ncbi:MAG: hypothetical protein KKG47_01095 [Proteobacteria bacterium]|nr:hypothetical protein [Pseudomonadota bacterium]MBU1736662.1 hypothetical protein [Pseudomonadota bacterium]
MKGRAGSTTPRKGYPPMNNLRTLFSIATALFFIVFAIPLPAHAEDSAKEVVATGLGGGEPAKARDAAINDALRKAVEQGVGTYVSSETLVQQMMLIEDRIYSESRGFVQKYEILNEKKEDGIYEVKIKALVKMAELAKELEAIGIILRKKQNPRVMVLVHSRETNSSFLGVELEGNRSSENQLEKILLQKGFRLVDASQTSRKKQLSSLLLADNPSQAASLAKDFGAEILIEADVRRSFVDERKVLGRSMRFFTNEIRLKALETDTAKILYSGYDSLPASGAASLQPLEETTGKLAQEMVTAILEQWSKDVYQSATFQINLASISYTDLNAISEGLRELRGMGQIQTRSFQGGSAVLEVSFQGSINDLADGISGLKEPKLRVTGLQANTIEVKLAAR